MKLQNTKSIPVAYFCAKFNEPTALLKSKPSCNLISDHQGEKPKHFTHKIRRIKKCIPEKFGVFFPKPIWKYIRTKGNGAEGAEVFWTDKFCTGKIWWEFQVTKFVHQNISLAKFSPWYFAIQPRAGPKMWNLTRVVVRHDRELDEG